MKTYLECIPCFIRQTIEASQMATEKLAIQKKALNQVLKWCQKVDVTKTPPEMGQRIHTLIRKLVKNADPYLEVKNEFNQLILSQYQKLQGQILTSADPLQTALRLAIAGNIIDFGVCAEINKKVLDDAILKTLTASINPDTLASFRKEIEEAKSILYIGDNAGEIVFDRLLIEQFPPGKVTYVVRGGPIINDVTRKEAEEVGMDQVATVIDNGWNAPGTVLSKCSSEFLKHYKKADMIIAKGQGNYETLGEEKRGIYFILKIKCSMLAKHTGRVIGDLIFENR